MVQPVAAARRRFLYRVQWKLALSQYDSEQMLSNESVSVASFEGRCVPQSLIADVGLIEIRAGDDDDEKKKKKRLDSDWQISPKSATAQRHTNTNPTRPDFHLYFSSWNRTKSFQIGYHIIGDRHCHHTHTCTRQGTSFQYDDDDNDCRGQLLLNEMTIRRKKDACSQVSEGCWMLLVCVCNVVMLFSAPSYCW